MEKREDHEDPKARSTGCQAWKVVRHSLAAGALLLHRGRLPLTFMQAGSLTNNDPGSMGNTERERERERDVLKKKRTDEHVLSLKARGEAKHSKRTSKVSRKAAKTSILAERKH